MSKNSSAVTQPLIPSRHTRPCAQVITSGIREESPRLKGHKVLISLTAGPSSNTVSEMVEFSFGICWQSFCCCLQVVHSGII